MLAIVYVMISLIVMGAWIAACSGSGTINEIVWWKLVLVSIGWLPILFWTIGVLLYYFAKDYIFQIKED